MKKVFAAIALSLAAPVFSSAPAIAAETAGADIDAAIAFARNLTDKASAALTSDKSEAEQLADFQAVLSEGLALDVIGKFMIGDIRKSMTPEQIERYDAAFPAYLTRLYADQFADIVGRPLEVVDSKALGAKDVIVRTQFTRAQGEPINVDWRIRKLRSGDQKAIDIIVGGVSIMLVKREEFSAYIAQNSVDALIERIRTEGGA
ncbi:MAG: ABC transporter substrate-binding protein [Parvularculaceae bacterium]|nr:ABC transporter substrate-binding protein [Parvularculaceae bacterium]